MYELDRLLIDLLLARSEAGVRPIDIGTPIITERRASWYAHLSAPDSVETVAAPSGPRAGRHVPADTFRTHSTPYGPAQHERTLDVVGIDYYDPVASHHFANSGRPDGRRTLVGPGTRVVGRPASTPAGLARYCRANITEGLDLWIVENGICNRVRRGRRYPRLDRWDRIGYLRENLSPPGRRRRRRCADRRLLPLDPGRQLRMGKL